MDLDLSAALWALLAQRSDTYGDCMNRLLQYLESEIANSRDNGERGVFQVKRGIYLARIGQFAQAKELAKQLRSDFGVASYPRVAIMIILLEGVIDHYENLGSYGVDRILRSSLLSIATADPELIAVTSSWRAHVEFERSNFKAMVLAISEVQQAASPSSHDAHARCARILSDCFALTGDRQRSKFWFDVAHRHAVAIGDQAMLDAIIYNSVAFGLSRIRSESCLGKVESRKIRMMETALSSSRSYQALIGARALTHLVDVCGARLLMMKGEYSEAIDALSGLSQAGPMAPNNFSQDLNKLELAYCHAEIEQINVAADLLAQIEDRRFPGIDVDDRLAAAWMCHRMSLIDDRLGSVSETLECLAAARVEYQGFVSDLEKSITSLASEVSDGESSLG